MREWVVDDGPLGIMAQNFNPAWRWPAGHLHVSEAVAAGAAKDKSGRRAKLLATKDASGSNVFIEHRIAVGTSVADMVYKHLRPTAATATRDLGEDESIALCALELHVSIFVSMDHGAIYQALVELGPARVASPFDLWRELLDEKLITQAEFDAMSRAVVKRDNSIAGVPKRYL